MATAIPQTLIDRLTKYNEREDGPAVRLYLEFEDEPAAGGAEASSPAGPTAAAAPAFAVVLLNSMHKNLFNALSARAGDLAGKQFMQNAASDGEKVALQLSFDLEAAPDISQEALPLNAQTLAANGAALMIPLVDLGTARTAARLPFVLVGLVVTGSQFLERRIRDARMLRKDEPTPFVADDTGDSYNESFDKEPRVIDSVPETVFKIIDELLALARTLYQAGDVARASAKYAKAFHYADAYLPDALDPPDLERLVSLKVTSLLNLSLTANKIGEHQRALDATRTLLELPELADMPVARAKALYRQGTAYLGLHDEASAVTAFEGAQALQPDPATARELERARAAAADRRRREGRAFQGAFR